MRYLKLFILCCLLAGGLQAMAQVQDLSAYSQELYIRKGDTLRYRLLIGSLAVKARLLRPPIQDGDAHQRPIEVGAGDRLAPAVRGEAGAAVALGDAVGEVAFGAGGFGGPPPSRQPPTQK